MPCLRLLRDDLDLPAAVFGPALSHIDLHCLYFRRGKNSQRFDARHNREIVIILTLKEYPGCLHH